MNEHEKLIAKIQYFFDLLSSKHDFIINEILAKNEDVIKNNIKVDIIEINASLEDEYKKIFEDFLYLT